MVTSPRGAKETFWSLGTQYGCHVIKAYAGINVVKAKAWIELDYNAKKFKVNVIDDDNKTSAYHLTMKQTERNQLWK